MIYEACTNLIYALSSLLSLIRVRVRVIKPRANFDYSVVLEILHGQKTIVLIVYLTTQF